MFKRYAISLSHPSMIKDFRKDKGIFVVLYAFIICLFAIIPTIVSVSKKNGMTPAYSNQLRKTFVEIRNNLPQGGITDGALSVTEDYKLTYGRVNIFVNQSFNALEVAVTFTGDYNVYLKKNGVAIYSSIYSFSPLKEYSYEELKIKNLDFQLLGENDASEYAKVEYAVNKCIKNTAGFWKTLDVIYSYLGAALELFFSALIIAAVFKLKAKDPFRDMFKMAVYCLTMMIMGITIGDIFGLSLEGYVIGSLVSIVFMAIAIRDMENNMEGSE